MFETQQFEDDALLKGSSLQWGLTPSPHTEAECPHAGGSHLSALLLLFPGSQPNPPLVPIAYGKDWPIWLPSQNCWLRQENMPKLHQATRKHEKVQSWCCAGCLSRVLAVQGRPAPHLLTALRYLPAILPISSFCLALPVTQSIKWASYFIANLSWLITGS